MDQSGNRLLDLLKNSKSREQTDKDRLLALFDSNAANSSSSSFVKPPPASTHGSPAQSLRNGNASDLLATLIGKASPRSLGTPESRAEDSANLLSTLMGSSGGIKLTERQENTSAEASPPPKSYINPRHEFLVTNSPQPQAAQSNDIPKALFETTNPFDELEAALESPSTKQKEGSQTASARARRAQTSQSTSKHPASRSPRIRNVSVPSIATAPIVSTETAQSHQHGLPITQKSITQPAKASEPQIVAFRIPDVPSSACKLPTTAAPGQKLTGATPVTKMAIKPDPSNRDIIAASRRYISYPVTKDTAVGCIRIVDQDTGETTLLTDHDSRVIDLNFAKRDDEDGINALVSTDINNNINIWSLTGGTSKVEKILEIAGPSDSSHKSRAKWNKDGTYLGVAITSRIYVFDYRSLLASPRLARMKLHPDSKNTLCVCKADKAIKDFSFALDNTAIAGVDKLGKVKLWILDSSGSSIEASASVSTGERPLLSVAFVSTSAVVVGTSANESLLLVDLKAAKVAQELSFPALDAPGQYVTRSRLSFLPDVQLLLLNNEVRQSIYVISPDLPLSEGSTCGVISSLGDASSHIEARGRFGMFLECGLFKDQGSRCLGFSGVMNGKELDCFIAHERGYDLHSIDYSSLTNTLANAQSLDPATCTKLKSIGHFVSSTTKGLPADGKAFARLSSPEEEQRPSPRPAKRAQQVSESRSSGPLSTEPRTAELAARIEANLRANIVSEIQKSTATFKNHVEALQKDNDKKQEDILRLISETLNKNTSKVLKSTVAEAIEQSIVPNLKSQIDIALQAHLRAIVTDSVDGMLTRELSQSVHKAVELSFGNCGIVPQLTAATSLMSNDLNSRHQRMEQSLAGALVRLDAQILERQKEDSAKIDKLMLSIEALEKQFKTFAMTTSRNQTQASQPPLPQQSTTPSQGPQMGPVQNGNNVPKSTNMPEDFVKYHDLIMDFVTKTQRISAGDYDGVPFIKQFLSWQPDGRVKDGICRSLSADQLQLLAFIHALASELKEDDAYNRVHWIASALPYLKTDKWDARLEVLGPRLFNIICQSLITARDAAPPSSQYKHLLDVICSRISG